MFPRSIRTCAALLAVSLLLTMGGCARRTPEERLTKAMQAMQQRDTLTAMLEIQELLKKYPDDPSAVDAHMLLAQVYYMDQRPDDAIAEIKGVLDKVSQKDPRGREAMRGYLALLQQTKRFDEAKKAVDEYRKKYVDDEIISLNLAVAKADILTASKETSGARELLVDLVKQTTEPATLDIYREMMLRTYLVDRDTTGAVEYVESQIAKAGGEDKRALVLTLAMLKAQAGDYEGARAALTEGTKMYDSAIKETLDANKKQMLAAQLATGYSRAGNLNGAATTLRRIFDAGSSSQVTPQIVTPLADALLRQGKTSETVELLREAAARFPQSPFAAQATQIETLASQNMLERMAPRDTSPLVLRFAREELLVPTSLDTLAETTGTTLEDKILTGSDTAETSK